MYCFIILNKSLNLPSIESYLKCGGEDDTRESKISLASRPDSHSNVKPMHPPMHFRGT